jgi:hypothetical protein
MTKAGEHFSDGKKRERLMYNVEARAFLRTPTTDEDST